MSSALELKVVFAAVDKFIRPVKAITASASEAAKAMRDNTARMKEFNRTVEQIDAFKKIGKDMAIAGNAFAKNKREIDDLKAAMDRVLVPTKTMSDEMARLTKHSEELKTKHQSLTSAEQALFEKLKAAGIDTRNLAEHRQKLASSSAAAANASNRLQSALDAENQKMKRLHAAQADLTKSKELAGKLAMRGAGMTAAGAAGGAVVGKTIKDFADFETAMLGVARQMDGARDDGGKVTKTYWEMAASIKAMSERLPGTANDIAKIVEGGARMGIQGKENLLIFAETTAVMAKAFDLPVDQIGEDIGKISQLYKVPIKDIKQLGDTINFLDDNALAKGADIIDVMKRIAGTADMVNMSFKDAAALGSTFLSLGAKAEVAASASNAMIRELSIANMQSKRFKEGMAMIGMNGKDVQSSMNKDATGTIIKVLEKIKSLAGDKQLEAATRLFGKEYGDDAAKLASNLDEYRRQLQLVRDQKAMGSMQREADSWGDTLNARIENAKDAFANLSSDLGQSFKPAVAATLERTLSMVQAVRAWSAENPALSSGLMTALKWLAGTLTVLGALTMAAGAILVPLAAMKFSLVTLGITGSGAMAMLTTALSAVGTALGFAARVLLLNPIGLTLTAIATAATLIYLNWDKIGPWLAALIERISGYFSSLKDRAVNAGRELINGMIDGVTQRWDALRSTVMGVADSTIGWVRDKLGIKSPSRVFREIGAFTMQGFEDGISGNAGGPLGAMGDAARRLASVGAGIAIGTAPIAAGAASAAAGGNTYQIIINAPAGTDNQGLASLVAREIERIESNKAARSRSRLRDME
jgi:TP901 family phage tail tape measure protein